MAAAGRWEQEPEQERYDKSPGARAGREFALLQTLSVVKEP